MRALPWNPAEMKKAPTIGALNEKLLSCKDITNQEKVKGDLRPDDVKQLV
jgi:hypothetical protein